MLGNSKGLEDSFFELIDIEGKDNVLPDLESTVERLINSAVGYLLNMTAEYQVQGNFTDIQNPHFSVDLQQAKLENLMKKSKIS